MKIDRSDQFETRSPGRSSDAAEALNDALNEAVATTILRTRRRLRYRGSVWRRLEPRRHLRQPDNEEW